MPDALWVTDSSSSLTLGSSLFQKPHTHPALGERPVVHQAHFVKQLTVLWVISSSTFSRLSYLYLQFAHNFQCAYHTESALLVLYVILEDRDCGFISSIHLICFSQIVKRPLLCSPYHVCIRVSLWPLTPAYRGLSPVLNSWRVILPSIFKRLGPDLVSPIIPNYYFGSRLSFPVYLRGQ